MQLPTTATDSDSDDGSDLEIYQLPAALRIASSSPQQQPDLGEEAVLAGSCNRVAEAQHANTAPVSTAKSLGFEWLPGSDSDNELEPQSPHHVKADASLEALEAVSVPLSSTSSALHMGAAAPSVGRPSSSDDSSSSSDSDSSTERQSSSFSSLNSTAAPAAPAAVQEVQDPAVLNMDCLLADIDLDALLARLAASSVGSSTGVEAKSIATDSACSRPGQHAARQSSSDLSSDNSSSSLASSSQDMGTARWRDSSSPPPACSSTSTYEPRWLQQQRQHQQQQALHNASHSPAACRGHERKEKLWVPEPPSAVLDLRCDPAVGTCSSTEQGSSPAAHTTYCGASAVHAGPAAVGGAMGSKVAAGSRGYDKGHTACQTGSESDSDDSSEEDWQQFRSRQHARAGMSASVQALSA